MSDNERRIIDYDAFNDLPPNSWLIVDSEGQGTGKIAPIKIGATYEIQDGAHSFTLVGSNGYTHTVDIPYDSVQMSYEDYQALTEVQKMDGTNRFVPDVPTDDLEPEIWQRVGRTPLTTEEKTISPAINELKGRIDDSDTEIENIKSNLTQLDGLTVYRNLTPQTSYASFNDGSNLPLISLTTNIEPIQDLHGYDNPWVGGSGKNKLNLTTRASATVRGITSEVKADNTIVASGTSTGNGDITCPVETPFTMEAGETYTISLSGTDTRINQFTIFIGTSYRNVGVIAANNHSLTFTVASELVCNQIMLRASSGATININAKLQIELGSTATSYAPYSNICPISGFTEANVVVSPTTDAEDGTTYTVQFKDGSNPLTVYGGTLDVVSGELKVVPYYDSYNDETLEGEWISDRDVYAVGTTPTIGAQVVNIGATPQTYQLTPTQVNSLIGQNYIFSDTGDITNVKYIGVLNFS